MQRTYAHPVVEGSRRRLVADVVPIRVPKKPPVVVSPESKPQVRRQRWIARTIVFSVVLLAVGILSWTHFRPHGDIPVSVARAMNFPLYQPSWLPEGYVVDKGSFSATAQAIVFTYSDQSKRNQLVFSEQSRPAQFDFAAFYNQQLTDQKSLVTRQGLGIIGQFEGAPLASVVTDKTWVLIRAPRGINTSDFERIVYGLKQ